MSKLLTLVVIVLLVGAALVPTRANVRAQFAAKPAPVIKASDFEVQVAGWGKNQVEAEKYALVKARDLIKKHLANLTPPLVHLHPSTQYIKQNFFTGTAHRTKDPELKGVEKETGNECWVFPVFIHAEQFSALDQMDRQALDRNLKLERDSRMEVRFAVAGKVLIALLALLAAAYGYLRLEELTKGYYTTWLRVGIVGFLGAAGTGLWLLS